MPDREIHSPVSLDPQRGIDEKSQEVEHVCFEQALCEQWSAR